MNFHQKINQSQTQVMSLTCLDPCFRPKTVQFEVLLFYNYCGTSNFSKILFPKFSILVSFSCLLLQIYFLLQKVPEFSFIVDLIWWLCKRLLKILRLHIISYSILKEFCNIHQKYTEPISYTIDYIFNSSHQWYEEKVF